jgi:hypothetical protein
MCNSACVPFNGMLSASQRDDWLPPSGPYSLYQPVTTPTRSNFSLGALGFGVSVTFSGSLSVKPGRNNALIATVDLSRNPMLLLEGEGSVSDTGASGAPPAALSISSQPDGTGGLRFAQTSVALAPR